MTAVVRLLAAVALATTSLLVFGAGPAQACRCVPATVAQQLERADHVFTGVVRERSDDGTGPVSYDVAVQAVHKGEVHERVQVVSPRSSASCGVTDLPEGDPLVFFASADDPTAARGSGPSAGPVAVVHTLLCDGTGPATPELAAAVTAGTGQPRAPAPAPSGPSPDPADTGRPAGTDDAAGDGPGDGTPVWPWALGGAVLLGAGAAYAVKRRA